VVKRVAKSTVLRLEALPRRLPLAVSRASFASATPAVTRMGRAGSGGFGGAAHGGEHLSEGLLVRLRRASQLVLPALRLRW
jgi:hypothetical protein